MAQFDFGTIDPNVKTGSALAADLNQWRTALHSTHAGAARPSYAAPGMLWVDQANATEWQLKLATATGDTIIGGINTTTNVSINRFPDGTAAAPGIAWASSPDSGWFHTPGTGDVSYSEDGVPKFLMQGNSSGRPQFVVVGSGTGGELSKVMELGLAVDATGASPGFGMHMIGVAQWGMMIRSDGILHFGESNGGGPTAMGGVAFRISQIGHTNARSFNQVTFAAVDVTPMTGALSDLIKLRGVRCFNTETQKPDIRLEVDDIELAFPELVSELRSEDGTTVIGKGINYMALTAPIIEAIRELDARLRSLEIPA